MSSLGEAIAAARRAQGMTQEVLSDATGVTQAALSRYESGMRTPTDEVLASLAEKLGVTTELLRSADKIRGAAAVDAHMRRRSTAKASDWRRLEARLNMYRLHMHLLLDEIALRTELSIPRLDPIETDPTSAARMVRMGWRMPVGPVRSLVRWIESAGCVVVAEDFGTARVDGLSQWIGDYPIMLLNLRSPVDRLRLTMAHETGHLVLHSEEVTDDVEKDANSFAAEFLMPAEVIRPQLRNLTLGRLQDLKREWAVSMQALIERAYGLGVITGGKRTSLYKQLSSRGWRKSEPGSDLLPSEEPALAQDIGNSLISRGLSRNEAAVLAGFIHPDDSPFDPTPRRLRVV